MDIAGFVGFAASGPIDVPVPIEDVAQFEDVFGADAPLAWDAARGEQVQAFLAPAVRAFFRNGGSRCWVVRVADRTTARSDSFPLPGVAAVSQVRASGQLTDARLVARSEGSWADTLRVSASLEPTAVRFDAQSLDALVFDALLGSPDDLVVGDLVRVSFPDSPWQLLVGVESLAATGSDPRARTVQGVDGWWVRTRQLPLWHSGHLHYIDERGASHISPVVVEDAGPAAAAEGLVRIGLTGSPPMRGEPPRPGWLVRGVFSSIRVWLDVAEVDLAPDGSAALLATAFELSRTRPRGRRLVQAPGSLAERLTLRLQVDDASGGTTVLGGLGFRPEHRRFVGSLPTDAALYADPAVPPAAGTLAAAAAQPRFPLAGLVASADFCLPLGATILEGPSLGALFAPGTARRRDGLAHLDGRVFVDPELADTAANLLVQDAFRIEFQQPSPRPLRGMHALLDVDEVTIVAAPDAVHRDWYLEGASAARHTAAPERAPQPNWADFLDCATHVPATPVLEQVGDEESGTYTLVWSPTDVVDAVYELQESTDTTDDAAAETLVEGPDHSCSIFGRPSGSTLYYRVRAIAGGLASDWSNWVVVRRSANDRWQLDDAVDYNASDVLLPVQLALLRLCFARGDMLATLALPEHYRERDAIAHARLLRSSGPPPLFSYGALYYPWLYASDSGNPQIVRRLPPDGAAAGIIATRAARLGAWVAPANEPLRDVVQLDRPVGDEWLQALQDAQVNVVRHDPGGFLWLAEDTLTDDPELRPIAARRLLQLLRRAAILWGVRYVFEPDGDSLRRTVRRAFERLLAGMLELGAFAGATASESYQVSVDPPSDDASLVVELRVAPSRPLAFLTVRLVRTGEGALQVETR